MLLLRKRLWELGSETFMMTMHVLSIYSLCNIKKLDHDRCWMYKKNDRQVKSSHLLFPVTGSITPSGNGKWRQEGMWGEDVKKMVWWLILVDNYYVLLSMYIFLFLEKKCVTTTTILWSSRLLKRRNDNHANFMCVVIQLLLPSSSNRNASR